ncbi:mitochondrial Rho GTPase 1 isoform X2 [Physcomitrium patens]|uniref:Mitochondrial Rho GTPase n=1 Tax=Physcomitrium patens TaxID=3218 RepID=A0A2K1JX93_PHYPA|nr:mitochondrial Rho GTPase 1-like isoform X2 [Physcomitrium patens]PNR46131.1 hypothetical protein PHYPA_013250 [Physcomitrium patens]|eukprot:XP_024387012.1 mitochondrial Rho GTPase 1-like isoform X2 [Physcomitrella patens]
MTGDRKKEPWTSIQVVVIGDAGVGKSSMILTIATDSFAEGVPHVLPPTRLPTDFYPDGVPLSIFDTSARPEDKSKLDMELKKADVVVLTYACDQPVTLARLSKYWLPELRRLELNLPVIVVGCKLDLRDERKPSLEESMAPLMQEFQEIETCMMCSAAEQIQVAEVFYYAQKAVLHPTGPLFDRETQSLKPRCVRALKRIFILCDHDRDGALSDAELNEFQVKCFNAPLQPAEIVGVKKVVSDKMAEGVNKNGLTSIGFLFLHALFIERGRLETTWTVLRKFGYNDEITLRDDVLSSPSFKRASDQSVELTQKAIDFLREAFTTLDQDGDGTLQPAELEDMFSTAPSNPWDSPLYKNTTETNSVGGITWNGFISQWEFMTLLDPQKSSASLVYLGYPGDTSTAFQVTRRRKHDQKRQRSQRGVIQCFIFGPRKSGKSAILDALIGRPFKESYDPSKGDRYAINKIGLSGGANKTLIMREINEASVSAFLEDKEALAPCNVAAFVYDSSSEESLKRAAELLEQVAVSSECSGYEVPCLLLAAKNDEESNPSCITRSARICSTMGLETPTPVSMKLGDNNNLFLRIVEAAQHPHLSIPETELGKSTKQHRQLIQQSVGFVLVGTTLIVGGITLYRLYNMRKLHSSS